jgi:hypothetical protein
MIDPRALQQHFKKVNQRQEPKQIPVPRVPDVKPLTTVQAISIIPPVPAVEPTKEPEVIQPTIDTSLLQEELKEVTQALTTLKQSLSEVSKIEIPKIEPVTITVPVSVVVEEKPLPIEPKPIIVEEVKPVIKQEEETTKEETPYGYSAPKKRDLEEYNPYGYYSGPSF